ncbi:MAG TPA: hypothetical protein VFU31_29870 [Candidatus Binatia bacterium]|nr:hypothetical protein [Candidatus Binatia bacterium]
MRETDDDWMYPQTSYVWTSKPHADGTFYLISRKRRIPVSGNVSHIEEWETWKEFSDKVERDAELKRLRDETTWVLRADQVIYMGGKIMHGSNPRDLIDV